MSVPTVSLGPLRLTIGCCVDNGGAPLTGYIYEVLIKAGKKRRHRASGIDYQPARYRDGILGMGYLQHTRVGMPSPLEGHNGKLTQMNVKFCRVAATIRG